MLEKTPKLRKIQHFMSVLFIFMSRSQERGLEQTQFVHLIVLLSACISGSKVAYETFRIQVQILYTT